MREGKVKHLGVANFGLSQVEKLLQTASVKPVVNQVELHPYLSQRKLVGTCRRKVSKCHLGLNSVGRHHLTLKIQSVLCKEELHGG